MKSGIFKTIRWLAFILGLCSFSSAFCYVKGIYLTYWTAQSTSRMQSLIQEAKQTGINTFVIDVEQPRKLYEKNIDLVKKSGINYVARVVVFPQGGTPEQIKSKDYWNMRWKQAQYALSLGADAIQLDYIRYKASQKPSDQNANDIYQVISFFKNKMKDSKAKLQIDVFGISSFKPSVYIGQNLKEFIGTVDALCPMVYPSHFEPFPKCSQQPYETIHTSLVALKKQLGDDSRLTLIPYIELSNYRYPMSRAQRIKYVQAEIKALQDVNANGWYFWSANNKYQLLFDMLKAKQI